MLEIKPICEQLCLGKQGENLARFIHFKEPELWKEKFGEGVCELLHKRNGDDAPYPVVLDVVDGQYRWNVTEIDTSNIGLGECELYYRVDGVVVKSKIMKTYVMPSLGGEIAEVPEPQKPWADKVLEAGEKVKEAVDLADRVIETSKDVEQHAKKAEQHANEAEAFASKGNGHIADESNPHKVTASQVGAYSTGEVDEKLKNPSYEEQVKLTGITTAVPGWEGAYTGVLDDSIGSDNADFIIDIQGDVKFNTSCVGEPEHTADFYIDGEMVAQCHDGASFDFEGHVSQNIRVHCSFMDVYFIEFTKKVYVKDVIGDINGKIGDIDVALDAILAIQESIIGGIEQ